jgi:hypothetical protein
VFRVEVDEFLAGPLPGDIECLVSLIAEEGEVCLKARLNDSFLLLVEDYGLLFGTGKGVFLSIGAEACCLVFDPLSYVGVCVKGQRVSAYD